MRYPTCAMAAAAGLLATSLHGAMMADEPAAEPDLIPREVFFGNPDRAGVQLSPDGAHLSFLAPHSGVLNVWVQTIGAEDARVITAATDRPITNHFWAQNGDQILYTQDRGGDENHHLYAVDLATGDEINLTPFEKVQARVTATDRNHPDEILVSVNNRNPQLHDVWRVNTRTGERELVLENNQGYAGFIADTNYQIRIAMRIRMDGGSEAFVRDSNDDEWTELVSWNMEEAMNSSVVGIARDNKTLYLIDSRDTNTSRFYALEYGEDGPTRRLITQNDRCDLSGAMIDPKTGHPQAIAFEYARTEWEVLDDSIREDLKYLRTVADGELSITSRDRADAQWIAVYVRDDGPVEYYLYDRGSRHAEFLFTNRSELIGLELAKMKPVIIKSRDGLNLVSYLTTPVGLEAKNLPMVLLVHGGPWARDSWGYNSLHQWMANRGYAVLSVNFRGSTGFGKDFVNAANYEWADKMHNDLLDAVDWAVSEGIADPKRVAIMGGSYGGYATLVGLTFTPDVFAAGVDIVGPSHIRTLLESIPPYWKPIIGMFESRVGKLSDPDYLDEISPLTKVDQITKPLLIGQGANDPRVKEAESKQIVEAMTAKNIPVTYVVFPNEGHGFANPSNNMAFFAVTEVFLAQHLGGRFQEIGSDVRQSTADIQAGAELIPGLKDQ